MYVKHTCNERLCGIKILKINHRFSISFAHFHLELLVKPPENSCFSAGPWCSNQAKGSSFRGSFPLHCLTRLDHGPSSLETPGATASPSQAVERLRLLITLTCCQGSHVTGCYVAFCRYVLIVWLNSCLDAAAAPASSPYLLAAGIICDRARLVAAELLVVWQVYHDTLVWFSQRKYKHGYTSFINVIELAYFPRGHLHCFEGSVHSRLVALVEANTPPYISLCHGSPTVSIQSLAILARSKYGLAVKPQKR